MPLQIVWPHSKNQRLSQMPNFILQIPITLKQLLTLLFVVCTIGLQAQIPEKDFYIAASEKADKLDRIYEDWVGVKRGDEETTHKDYLNIANGRVASPFSLFYSEYIQYACVDSITAEFNLVAFHMDPEGTLRFDCAATSSSPESIQEIELDIYPNPASDFLQIQSQSSILRVEILGHGKLIALEATDSHRYSIEHLPNGLYTVLVETSDGLRSQRFLKVD